VRVRWTGAAVVAAAALLWLRPWWYETAAVVGPRRHLNLAELGGSAVVFTVLWALLPRVSYRRGDALLVLLPVAPLCLVALLAWRLSALPYRDWRPRDDELARVRVVPGTPYYVLAPSEPPA
jgi:hypothetical protein